MGGDTGWKVEAEFKIDGDKIKHPCVSMKAVCQPLQADGPEVPQDGNMRIVSKLLRGLATINKEGSQLKLGPIKARSCALKIKIEDLIKKQKRTTTETKKRITLLPSITILYFYFSFIINKNRVEV